MSRPSLLRHHQVLDVLSQVAVLLCLTLAVAHVAIAAGLLPAEWVWSGHDDVLSFSFNHAQFIVWNVLYALFLILAAAILRRRAIPIVHHPNNNNNDIMAETNVWIQILAWIVTAILTTQTVLDIMYSSAVYFVAPLVISVTLCSWIIASLDGILACLTVQYCCAIAPGWMTTRKAQEEASTSESAEVEEQEQGNHVSVPETTPDVDIESSA